MGEMSNMIGFATLGMFAAIGVLGWIIGPYLRWSDDDAKE